MKNRKTSFTERLAAIVTIAIFLFPDVSASANALSQRPWENFANNPAIDEQNNLSKGLEDELVTLETVEVRAVDIPLEDEFSFDVAEKQVLIGRSSKDPLGSPSNDVVSFQLNDKALDHYKSATISYEISGVQGGSNLVRSVNDVHVYGSPSVIANQEWQSYSDPIDIDDLRAGINTIRFNLPTSTNTGAQLRNITIELSTDNEESQLEKLPFEQLADDSKSIELLGFSAPVYVLNDAQTPSIPSNIFNVTEGAYAFYVESAPVKEGDLIKVAINKNMVPPGNRMEEIQVYYFNNGNRKWVPVMTDSMAVDIGSGATYKYVPPQPGNFYMAGSQRTPSMPETSASFLDRMGESSNVGSPMAGVSVPSTPQINQQGDAATSLAFNFPKGRNGMQPAIAANYSSSNPGSYMGVGWSIPFSTISVSIKWGVPTFNTDFESEVYALDGEDLTMEGGFKPNRYDGQGDKARETGSVQFFEKTRGTWKKIERIGDLPEDYVWVVTDENNTKFYYGTSDGIAVDNSSTLRKGGNQGNIAQWNLRRIVDQWGNVIQYNYSKGVYSKNDDQLDQGQWMYPASIEYTGYLQGGSYTPGQNRIRFEYNSLKRSDARTNLRYGFKVSDFKLLSKVHIEHVDASNITTAIREYQFTYDESTYKRKRLVRIAEVVDGNEFYANNFEYHDDKVEYEANEVQVDVQGLIVPNNDDGEIDRPGEGTNTINSKFSPIGGSFNEHYNGGAYIGAGLGVNPFSKGGTVGGGTYFGLDFTNGRSSLQDITGDGIPDLLWQLPNTSTPVQFQRGQLNDNRELSFSSSVEAIQPETGVTANKYSRSRNVSNASTVNGYIGLEGAGASFGHSWNWSRGKNTHFLTDANADGIADLVVRGDVSYGKLNPTTGEIEFHKTSELTPNPIINFTAIDKEKIDNSDSYPLEVVKCWTAPMDGQVTFKSTLVVNPSSSNGVQASVEKYPASPSSTIIASQVFQQNSSTPVNSPFAIDVHKGDMIYFRLGANGDPELDLVTWNPEISYVGGTSVSEGNTSDWLTSKYSEGFLLSTTSKYTFQEGEKIRIDIGSASLPSLTDDVTLDIELTTSNGTNTVVTNIPYTQPANSSALLTQSDFVIPSGLSDLVGSSANGVTVPSGYEYSIAFTLSSRSNVDWQDIDWNPKIQIKKGVLSSWKDIYPALDVRVYSDMVRGSSAIKNVSGIVGGANNFLAIPDIDNSILAQLFPMGIGDPITATFVSKTDGALLKAYDITFGPNSIVIETNGSNSTSFNASAASTFCSLFELVSISSLVNDELHLGYYTENPQLASALAQYAAVRIKSYDAAQVCTNHATISNPSVFTMSSDRHIGTEYLGWGQFGWDETSVAITPSQMVLPVLPASQYPDFSTMTAQQIENFIDNNGLSPSSSSSHFTPFYPKRSEAQITYFNSEDGWINPFCEYSGALKEKASPSIGGYQPGQSSDDLITSASSPFDKAVPMIRTRSFNTSWSVSGNATIVSGLNVQGMSLSVGVSGAKSITDPLGKDALLRGNRIKRTFMDINGDGYPDDLQMDDKELFVRKTNPLGGYEGLTSSLGNEVFISRNDYVSEAETKGADAFVSLSETYMKLTGSASVSEQNSSSFMKEVLIDLNGDGIPDRYKRSAKKNSSMVPIITLGDGSSDYQTLPTYTGIDYLNDITGEAKPFSFGVGLNMVDAVKDATDFQTGLRSFSGGYSRNHYIQQDNISLIDINADGLIDQVYENANGQLQVRINTGTGFTSANVLSDVEKPEFQTVDGTVNASATIGVIQWGVKAVVSPSVSIGAGKSQSIVMMLDVNGDGLPDQLSVNENKDYDVIMVRYAKPSKANLLKKVTNPLGGTTELEYSRIGNKYGYYDRTINDYQVKPIAAEEQVFWDMPNSKWVLSEVTLSDNVSGESSGKDYDGTDQYTVYYNYDGGVYSRRERNFNGFVRTQVKSEDYMSPQSSSAYSSGNHQSTIDKEVESINEFYTLDITCYPEVNGVDHQLRAKHDYISAMPQHSYSVIHFADVLNADPIELDHQFIVMQAMHNNYNYYLWIDDANNSKQGRVEFGATVGQNISETSCLFPALAFTESQNFIDDSEVFFAKKTEFHYDNKGNIRRVIDNGCDAPAELVWNTIAQTDQGPIRAAVYPTNYTVDLIALMEYHLPMDANDRTGQLHRFRLWQNDTVTPANLLRKDSIPTLHNGRAAEKIMKNDRDKRFSTYEVDYDAYGNAISIEHPDANNGDALTTSITYDTEQHRLPVVVKNTYLLQDGSTWDEFERYMMDNITGNLLKRVDINGNPTEFHYDGFHRIEKVFGPNEVADANAPYTLRLKYADFDGVSASSPAWVETWRYTGTLPSSNDLGSFGSGNDNCQTLLTQSRSATEPAWNDPDIQRSAIIIDGLGRPVQSKKEVSYYNGTANEKRLLISGFSASDNLGRAFAGTLPVSAAQSSSSDIHQVDFSAIGEIAQVAYYNRFGAQYAVESVTANAQNNGVAYTPVYTSYNWSNQGLFNQHLAIENYTDASSNMGSSQNQKTVSYVDARGNVAGVVEGIAVASQSMTTFEYDKIGQRLKITDPAGVITTYAYDRLGRAVEENHVDKGLTEIEYGQAGNIITTTFDTDAGGRESITFDYEYNRLISKSFAGHNDINGLSISYGRPGDGRNGAGRIVSSVQGNDLHIQDFYYDALGNTIRDKETIAVPLAGEYTMTTDYTYDSWGRVNHMRYPDGEEVSYGYAPGGELESVSSNKAFVTASNTSYVSKIGYDGFGARKYLKYGNGTETDYDYNGDTRQAKRMELFTSENNATANQIKILDKSYQYNGLGMISSISNTAGHLGSSLSYNDLGGSYAFNYTYDDHGRLTTVDNSSWTGSEGTWNYSLDMSYAKDGRILSKDQGFVHSNGNAHNTKDYTLNYTYNTTGEVHQLMQISEDGNAIDFTYNARGGVKTVDNSKTNELTTYAWDSDMRLWGTENNSGIHHNVYDWTGTRLMKSSLTSATVYVNGNPTTTYSVMPYIVYAGSHYVFEMYQNDVEVSKHYFAGGERIATKMEVVPRLTSLYSDGETPYPTNYFGSFNPDDGNGSTAFDPIPTLPQENNIVLDDLCRLAFLELGHSVECDDLKKQSLPDYAYNTGDRDACWASESPFVPVVTLNIIDYCNCTTDPVQAQANGANCNLYPFIYWYHHDHKGSTEFVTDLAGMVYEYHLYSPFGESLISQNAGNSGYSNPYKFSGAIEDPETGLTYNVARFYNAKWSMWMSPDPMSFAREWVTPYNYVLNNPVNRIDATGLLCKSVNTPDHDPPNGINEDFSQSLFICKHSIWKRPKNPKNNEMPAPQEVNQVDEAQEVEHGTTLVISISTDTDYRIGHMRILNPEIKEYEHREQNSSTANLGELITNTNSSDENGVVEPISLIVIFSHGFAGYIFTAYSANNIDDIRVATSDISDEFETAIANGNIVFTEDAVIYLGACNAGTTDPNGNSFAQELADVLGVDVIAMVNDGVAPVKESKAEGTYTYGPKMNKGQFYRFSKGNEPVLIGDKVDVSELIKQNK